MKDQLAKLIADVLKEMGIHDARVEVEVPEDSSHGDYTTNVAMTLAKTLKKPPMGIALQVKEKLEAQSAKLKADGQDQNIGKRGHSRSPVSPLFPTLSAIDHIEVAPPGFINVFLTEASLITHLQEVLKQKESYGKRQARVYPERPRAKSRGSRRVMVEFAHPNTHKAFHIGHLRNISTAESVIRLLESQGNEVIRTNYQGDVGLHIAKCLYSILRVQSSKFKVQSWKDAKRLPVQERVEYLGEMYAAGSKAFEEDAAAKEEIVSLNALVYAAAQRLARERGIDPGTTDYLALVKDKYKDRLETVYMLWKETRQWSLDYFEAIYKRVGSRYDRYYFESECLAGVDLAKEALKKGVLKKDAGAIIFDGKPYGLDTRVFVNSLGLPTYEGKELKLATMETTEHGKLDRMIHVVGPEQASFFQVTFKVEELLGIVRRHVQHHLIYGWVKLKHGKMSSRSGNVVLGEWLLDEAKKAIYSILDRNISKNKTLVSSASSASLDPSQREIIAEKAAVAAVKYAFLKVSTTSEIAFDIEESVNFQGDSGPYLQYTYARARSVLRKAQSSKLKAQSDWSLNPEERAVARLLTYFPDVVAEAADTFSPSTICTYLFRLAQSFNLFYAKHSILGMQEEAWKVDTLDSLERESGHLDTLRNQDVKTSKRQDQRHPSSTFKTSGFRLALTAATARVLKNGLYLLGIEVLEQM